MPLHSSKGVSVHNPLRVSSVDWRLLVLLSPPLMVCLAWVVWGFFLVIPSLFGLHSTVYVNSWNNTIFSLVGLTECLASWQALQAKKIGLAVLLSASVYFLAYWF